MALDADQPPLPVNSREPWVSHLLDFLMLLSKSADQHFESATRMVSEGTPSRKQGASLTLPSPPSFLGTRLSQSPNVSHAYCDVSRCPLIGSWPPPPPPPFKISCIRPREGISPGKRDAIIISGVTSQEGSSGSCLLLCPPPNCPPRVGGGEGEGEGQINSNLHGGVQKTIKLSTSSWCSMGLVISWVSLSRHTITGRFRYYNEKRGKEKRRGSYRRGFLVHLMLCALSGGWGADSNEKYDGCNSGDMNVCMSHIATRRV